MVAPGNYPQKGVKFVNMAERHLNRGDIEAILPHRRPFLFLESAVILEPGKLVTGRLTDLTHPDFGYLGGHFPNLPITPGAILMEALAELSGVVASSSDKPEVQGKVGVLGEDHMKYRGKILPVEATLAELEAEIISLRSRAGKTAVKATREGRVLVEGEILFVMVNRSEWSQ